MLTFAELAHRQSPDAILIPHPRLRLGLGVQVHVFLLAVVQPRTIDTLITLGPGPARHYPRQGPQRRTSGGCGAEERRPRHSER